MDSVVLKCMVVDDSSLQRLSIIRLVKNNSLLELVAECNNALKAKEALQKSEIDLVFLDIEMPIMSGFDLLKGLSKKPEIIVISGKTDYAFKAFDHSAIDYLQKPVVKERFDLAVQKAYNVHVSKFGENISEDDSDFIMIKSKLKNYKILLKNINYIEAAGDYVKIRTITEVYEVLSTLKNFNKRLPDYFLRVHKSYVVNLRKIQNYTHKSVEIDNISLPVSRGKKDIMKEFLSEIPAN